MSFWLFVFGAVIGSFLNVVAIRYEPDRFLLSKKVVGGRSRCPNCGHELKWFELVPVLSFVIQRGRCRKCHKKISLQYPIVEILSGLIFLLVPSYFLSSPFVPHPTSYLLAFLWILIFITLLLLSVIDIRTNLIPDEANIFLGLLAPIIILLSSSSFSLTQGSFLGSYSLIFGLRENILANHLVGALFGAGLFGFLILITRGRGMGMGDLKLALALGLVFGWPDIVLICVSAFVVGSVFGLGAILLKKKGVKSAVPFGPFIALGAAITFFFGYQILEAYFKLFSL